MHKPYLSSLFQYIYVCENGIPPFRHELSAWPVHSIGAWRYYIEVRSESLVSLPLWPFGKCAKRESVLITYIFFSILLGLDQV